MNKTHRTYGWLDGRSLTSLFSTNAAISDMTQKLLWSISNQLWHCCTLLSHTAWCS